MLAKPCFFVGGSRRDLSDFPDEVRAAIGHALHLAQRGEESLSAKALRGFGGRAVMEIVEDFDGNAYRAIYTVRFPAALYVLHAFQKKSKRGAATPKQEIELIKRRLKEAEADYMKRFRAGE